MVRISFLTWCGIYIESFALQYWGLITLPVMTSGDLQGTITNEYYIVSVLARCCCPFWLACAVLLFYNMPISVQESR